MKLKLLMQDSVKSLKKNQIILSLYCNDYLSFKLEPLLIQVGW